MSFEMMQTHSYYSFKNSYRNELLTINEFFYLVTVQQNYLSTIDDGLSVTQKVYTRIHLVSKDQ